PHRVFPARRGVGSLGPLAPAVRRDHRAPNHVLRALARRVGSGGSMRVAVAGLGYWGPKLIRNLVSIVGAEQVVAVDEQPHRRFVLDEFPGVEFKSSLKKALDDDDVEAVVVATPVESHGKLAKQALRAGRHVLVEKPLAGSEAQAVELARLADELD